MAPILIYLLHLPQHVAGPGVGLRAEFTYLSKRDGFTHYFELSACEFDMLTRGWTMIDIADPCSLVVGERRLLCFRFIHITPSMMLCFVVSLVFLQASCSFVSACVLHKIEGLMNGV